MSVPLPWLAILESNPTTASQTRVPVVLLPLHIIPLAVHACHSLRAKAGHEQASTTSSADTLSCFYNSPRSSAAPKERPVSASTKAEIWHR